ncbi:MAG TPA: GAF domain-containing SpoIIE family protein phosphatase [Streptosporangiaceae bacterium]|nr:GAF domain-containing SpoIIE family protein phosphatase [Streptosporangiaceae bacterium]
MTADPDHPSAPCDNSRFSALTAEGLRLGTGEDLAEIARMALDSLVPGFADAAVVYVAEHLLRDGDLASGSPGGRDGPELTVRRVAARSAGNDHGLTGFPPGQAVVLAAGSPYAQCAHEGKPVLFARPDSRTPVLAGPCSPYCSFLAVPMTAGSSTAGLIALAREPDRTAFGEDDMTAIAHLAAITGASITKAVTLAWHQAITAALQRGLLGAEPVRPEHLDVAGRCLPARGHLVGGDWYDIIALPAGRTGIVVGDVMGHGPEAAAIMAQLRAAAHVLAQQDLRPAELLGHLDRLIATLPGMPLATCAYAVIDPARQSCTFSAAGHLPPVLALPDGSTQTLNLAGGQSLGIGPASYGQVTFGFPPGAVIAMYTDGLVETRTRSFDQGIAALRTDLARPPGPLQATCDSLIRSLAPHPEDDVTLILVRIPPVSLQVLAPSLCGQGRSHL